MTPAETDARIVGGYHLLLSENLRLAHAAILEYANANNDDYWPKGRDVIRFARFYGVKQTALGGLVGLLPYRIGRRTVWVDAARVRSCMISVMRAPVKAQTQGPQRIARLLPSERPPRPAGSPSAAVRMMRASASV